MKLGERLKYLDPNGMLIGPMLGNGRVWFVDNVRGSNRNSGESWDKPLRTIAAAIAKSNLTINWSYTPKYYNMICVKPGVYAENLTPAYYCHIVGAGILGTDTAAEVHPASGAAMAGTFLGCGLHNMRLEAESAHPVIDLGIANNSIIENCEIVRGIAGLATVGLDMENATHMRILNNRFISGVAHFPIGIRADHGDPPTADKFLHACLIQGNDIFAATAGIYIDQHNVAASALIKENFIARPVKGIDDNNGGSYCVGNWISASSDAIEHANSASRCIGNSVINNVSGAKETSGS
jgi:hypothetical protein